MVPWLLMIARTIRQKFAERYAGIGISETKTAILEVIARQDAVFCQKELAEQLNLSESNICSVIERMRKDGFIERCRSTIDRRKSVLRLTDQGVDKLTEVERLHTEFEANLGALVRAEELVPMIEQLSEALNRLDISGNEVNTTTRRVA